MYYVIKKVIQTIRKAFPDKDMKALRVKKTAEAKIWLEMKDVTLAWDATLLLERPNYKLLSAKFTKPHMENNFAKVRNSHLSLLFDRHFQLIVTYVSSH